MKRHRIFLLAQLMIGYSLLGCSQNAFRSEISNLIDVPGVKIIESTAEEEFAGLSGEGYVIEIYKLDNRTVNSFKGKKARNLPIKQGDKTWHKYDWTSTAADSLYNEVFLVALNHGGRNSLEKRSKLIRELIGRQGVFYAFYYRPDKDFPRDVQFFVFDTNTAILYIIESNV